ncbi:MAG: hypothetical protein V3U92_18255 [Cellulophaga sp.]
MQLFDDTFSYILITCSCLYIIEWLIGSKWQEKAKDQLELWWINLEDLSFSETILIPIKIGKNVLDGLYKKTKILLFTFYVKYFIIFTLPTLVMIGLLLYSNYYGIDTDNIVSNKFFLKLKELNHDTEGFVLIILGFMFWAISVPLLIVSALTLMFSYIVFLSIPSLYITIKLLNVALKKPSIIIVLLTIIIDIYLAYCLFDFSESAALRLVDDPTHNNSVFFKWFYTTYIFAASYIATFIHLIISSSFFILFFLDKCAKNIFSIILLRLSESEKGVLTQIGIIFGLLVKSGKELIKLLS